MKFKKDKTLVMETTPADTKPSKIKKTHESFKIKMQRWFFGLGKEFSRINWITKKRLLQDFCVVAIVVLLFATIFFAIDLGFLSSGIM